jgi:small basic protein
MRPRNLLILAVLWLFTLVTVASSFDLMSILILGVMFFVTYSTIRREMNEEYTTEPAPDEPNDDGDE